MNNISYTYILAANSTAMELYKISKETLMESNSCDFIVFKFSEWEEGLEDLEEWEESIPIDEATYLELHSNLCMKLRAFFKTTNPDPVLWL
ncbi:hypothetical protein CJ739_3698 [Mariniflexile rhizosphaerae]|uniref:hypothetical protein n=1 Tax=unclassified Mariniflexile TaxID=2643887 RepID=UPI000E332C9B|nr:hypothetical protein [Mariniflexile sp. TRM1-10]AXP82759.1 hypothetical protein CJ739_3698 [Mariniflexile sp. TRM1-10]